ncbi:MAG TPA: HAD-IIIC family phosphatase [Rhizomicrobium sp.]
MPEPVRLVVWDLDGTFWAGTLTEGGYTYKDENHSIIVELAKRGIVSSICSKNDFETVKAILVEKGLWDYIVFPSISWTPKGPRLQQLVEDVQLRPETMLLIDDNPQNLREAEHFVPGIQTAAETFIPQMLSSPLFKGKDDRELSRLKQYRLLQTRKVDEAVAGDNVEFLRSCNIRVTIEHDVAQHLDRAIELINRTNQLNFTKSRLPEDPERARRKLREVLSHFDVQAGLVRVTDRYGDYGYCGFYLARTRRGRSRLLHFCFSCRILNMGVESWLYERLGRPKMEIVGEVLTSLSDGAPVDWIDTVPAANAGTGETAARIRLARATIRGACTVSPLAHYFQMDADEVIGEFELVREDIGIRLDHSLTLRYALEGLSPAQMDTLRPLGFEDSDFETRFAEHSNGPCLHVLSNWIDWQEVVFCHRATGVMVPYKPKRGADPGDEDVREVAERARAAARYLRENFDFIGGLSADEADRTYDIVFDALPEASLLFVVAAPEAGLPPRVALRAAELNRRINSAAARHPRKRIYSISISALAGEDEGLTGQHYGRLVYYRLYQEICARYRELSGSERTAAAPGGATAAAPECLAVG